MVVDPRAAAEVVSRTGLPCVLLGLSNAPRPASRGGRDVTDLGAIVVPYGCAGGAPALAAQARGIPLIAVRANRCRVGVSVDDLRLRDAIVATSYAEAIGLVAALRARVALPVLRGVEQAGPRLPNGSHPEPNSCSGGSS
jgi:hypothetical protein